jgi:Ca2+-binding EF-hand superfamily protein
MNKILLIAASLTLAAVVPSLAHSADSGDKLEQAFKKADKDHDGSLDREEAKALPRVAKNFDQIDADKSGTVILDEIYASARKIAQQMEQHDKAKFDAADKDHDGTLDRQEAKVFPRISKNFDQIDVDKDGTVSPDEIKAHARAHHAAAKADAQKN